MSGATTSRDGSESAIAVSFVTTIAVVGAWPMPTVS
jgi:hypothetical protein